MLTAIAIVGAAALGGGSPAHGSSPPVLSERVVAALRGAVPVEAAHREEVRNLGWELLNAVAADSASTRGNVVLGSYYLMLSDLPWTPGERGGTGEAYAEGVVRLREYIARVDPDMKDRELVHWLFWPGWVEAEEGNFPGVCTDDRVAEIAEEVARRSTSPVVRIEAWTSAAKLWMPLDWGNAAAAAMRAANEERHWEPRPEEFHSIALVDALIDKTYVLITNAVASIASEVGECVDATGVGCSDDVRQTIERCVDSNGLTQTHVTATGSPLDTVPGLRLTDCSPSDGGVRLAFSIELWEGLVVDDEWRQNTPPPWRERYARRRAVNR